jgi:DNA-binding NtrC family response regulator
VITDQIMPGMTGVELAKKLMAIRPGIRVILCTGHLENISPEEARATGICGFITKPATKEELAELIHRCLTGSGSG